MPNDHAQPIARAARWLRGGAGVPAVAHDAFLAALEDPDPGRFDALVARLRAQGVEDDVLLDEMVPRAARALGAGWVEDRVGFAAVAIGCARLQGLLHRSEPVCPGPESGGRSALVTVMPGTQHILGALLAASQLRRARVAVRLSLGSGNEIAETARRSRPALVALSAPTGICLASLGRLTEKLRRAAGTEATLAIGGSLVTAPGVTEDDLARIARSTGADVVGPDILGAAARCGLTAPARTVLRDATS